MKGLLKKDMLIIMEQKAIGLILIICCIAGVIIARGNYDFSVGFIDGYMTIIGSMTVLTTISYDESENGMAYIMSMPVSRKMYVNGKYLIALIVSAGVGLILTGMNFIMAVAGEKDVSSGKFMMITFCIIAVSLIISSIGIPAYLKYGAKKGAAVNIMGILIIVAVCFLLVKVIENAGFDLASVVRYMGSPDSYGLSGLVLTVAAICLIISYGISQKIMRIKEF